ncbi:low-density lipoprotein receptor-related protein 1-like [Diadema antillarum]|uniref:low-density lipoprotein receptor-related protein 1-like n=1 Tax=Diadema antillarum TaxID=105358 RepID=UPI003A8C4DC9
MASTIRTVLWFLCNVCCLACLYHCNAAEARADKSSTCEPGYIQCASNGVCLPEAYQCDGQPDCTDGSDEGPECQQPPPLICPPDLQYICHDGRTCISYHQICDAVPDCLDGLDEGAFCNPENSNECASGPCGPSQQCVETFDRPLCVCPEGFQAPSDNPTVCQDIDECDMYGTCDQVCTNTEGSYNCSCAEGYVLHSFGRCEATGEAAYLLVANVNNLLKLNLDGTPVTDTDPLPAMGTRAMDYDLKRNKICWVNFGNHAEQLKCAGLKKMENVQVQDLILDLTNVEPIAIDWVTSNIYLMDDVTDAIIVCRSAGDICITLVESNLHRPKGLALDPNEGLMFFTDWGTTDRLSRPKIEKALMDGRERIDLEVTKIVFPHGITADYPAKRIYFADTQLELVQSVKYDGTGQRIIKQGPKVSHLYSLTLFENTIYATKWDAEAEIVKIDKLSGNVTRLARITNRAGSIHVVHPHRQSIPSQHPCRTNNGGCEHLCLISGKTYQCRCQQGYAVMANGSCSRNLGMNRFLLFGQGYPGSVRAIPLEPTDDPNYESMVPILNLNSPRGVDFYAAEEYVYFADSTKHVIGRQRLNGTGREDLLTDYITNCEGIAVDWISKNLYWTDDGSNTISVARLDGSRRKLLLRENFTHPRAIVVDPEDGYMYWTDWSEGYGMRGEQLPQVARIERANMDGSNRVHFVREFLQWPNGLSLQKERGLLYWCDAFYDRISSIPLSGNGTVNVIVSSAPNLKHPFGITHYKDIVFWSEYRTGFIYRYDTKQQTEAPVSLRKGGLLFEIKLYDPNTQTGTNGCSEKNGGCQQLCLPVPSGYVCQCENGMKLGNETHCTEDPDYVRHSICRESQFECNNGRCIDQNWLCDGDNDCGDNTDETYGGCNNQTCGANKFQCPNNKCIPLRWTCDGDNDCQDVARSDEAPDMCTGHLVCPEKTCDADLFQCANGRCVSTAWRCDHENDCGDGSDEDNCNYTTCREGLFQCGNGACISMTWLCDRDDDCGDNSDEQTCEYMCDSETQFQCKVSLRCIDIERVCDDVDDCDDGSDDSRNPNCTSLRPVVCTGNEFRCDEQRCIPMSWVCDGEPDCHGLEDEAHCEIEPVCQANTHYKCPGEAKCIPHVWQCDGTPDCQDQSDEFFCAELGCDVGHWKCENHTLCIPISNLCDGSPQCINGSDEHACNQTLCSRSQCEEMCQPTPGLGVICHCPEGQVINPLKLTQCLPDSKMCSKRGRCSQHCISTKGSYKCECYPGYSLQDDRWSCKSNVSASPYVIFSNRNQLRRINLDSGEYNVLVFGLHNSIAVDFHYMNSTIYWTDVVDDKIYRGWLDDNSPNAGLRNIESVIEAGLATCEGLAVDWIGGNLYWVESHLDQIEVSRLDGAMRTTVVAGNMESPRAIALDPTVGLMFWTDWDAKNPRIERSTMSGQDRHVVVNINTEGGWPNGLTIDYPEKRIYWIDARSDGIQAANYDGSNLFTVLRGHNTLFHPFAISVFEGSVFWTDWRTNSVYQANKFNGSDVSPIQKTSTQPFDIHVYHPYRQPQKPNPCAVDNGGCSDLCLLNGNETACACPHLKKLHSNGKTCVNDTVFFVISRQTDIRGVDVDDGYYNVIPALTIPTVANASSIDHDTVENRIYWTDLSRKSINRAYINGTAIETVIEGIPNAYNLAIDWVSRNMYWTNVSPNKSVIKIARLDGSFQNEIDNLNLTNPRSIVIEPTVGMMYWINGEEMPTIEQARMDGTNQTSIVTGGNLLQPTGLAIDRSKQQLYWTDAGLRVIKNSNLNGSNIQVFLQLESAADPTAITVTNDRVFWAENGVGSIKYVEKDDPTNVNVLRGNTPGVMEMFMYNLTSQSGENGCKDQNGGCQQLCLPLPNNGRKCACTAGYITSKNMTTTCEGVSEFLLYSSDDTIRGLSLREPSRGNDGKDMLTPITGHMLSVAIDFQADENFIYWVDTAVYTLNRIKRDHTERQVLLTASNSRIEGIAVDWIAGNIYWTDQRNDVIEVSRTNGQYRYVLISDGLDKPRAIVVHPVQGYLFWADWGVDHKIERSLLNGKERTIIVQEDIKWPNGLVIDFQEDMLYWCDAREDNIGRVDFNGGRREDIFRETSDISDPFAITLSGNYLYFTDRTSGFGSIKRIPKHGQRNATNMLTNVGLSIKDIHVYSTKRQPGSSLNPCSVNNGNCSQLCFYLGGTNHTCACAHGTVAEDGRNCEEHEAYMLYSERNVIKSINVYNASDKNQPVQPLTNPEFIRNVIGLAVDYDQRRIFFTDIQLGSIQVININGTGLKTIISGIGSAEGIAYDPVFNWIYWTSYTNSSISRLSLDNPSRAEALVRLTAADHPRGIVLYMCLNYMFWTNWNEANPRIQRATHGGSNVTDIITDRIQMPNGLVIDHKSRRLYWSDAKLDKIERCDFNGSNRVVLLITDPVHPFGLAVFEDYVYWTDWVRRAVIRVDKYTAGDVTILRHNIPQQPMGIVVMARDVNNCTVYPCYYDNGGCDGTCTVNVSGHVICNCSERQQLIDETRCVTTDTNCNSGQFICRDGSCALYEESCDGKYHCQDGSDENSNYCNTRFCREGYIKCNNGRCVSSNRRCNGKDDCGDGSDEENCGCNENQFTCANGACISASSHCDNRLDCSDGSDELLTTCTPIDCKEWSKEIFFVLTNSSTFINCPNTTVCIHPSWRCDGANDCGDGTDELNCDEDEGGTTSAPCTEDQFQCPNGRCIQQSWVCDKENDCEDNSDEEQPQCSKTCAPGEYACANGNCIPEPWVCDRDNDCGDNSDENDTLHNCYNKTCSGGMFRCTAQRRCISQTWVCDGDNDCGNNEDEHPSLGCNVTRCKDEEFACANGRCIQKQWTCDHDDDCGDGSDEPDTCEFPTCGSDKHRCNNGRCIPLQWVCDGDKDCHDDSDEMDCESSLKPNNCSKNNLFQCANGMCVPFSAKCNISNDCGDGSDEMNCDCEVDMPCSQGCLNHNNGFWCYCTPGFRLLNDHMTCALEANQPKPHLLFSNRYQLQIVGVDGSNFSHANVNVTHAVALDFDWREQTIYWSDVTQQNSKISRANIKEGTIEVLHDLGVLNPDGLAVDWVGRNLYWCDKGLNVIEVSRLDGRYRKTLLKENLDEPRAIAVEPGRGLLFYTDWGSSPHIGRASMDGQHAIKLVTEKIQWPNALTIDNTTGLIFWGDAREDRIEFVSWNGTNRRTVVSEVPHIFAMSLFGDFVYWTDWELRKVQRAHKFNGRPRDSVAMVLHRPMDIQVLHPLRQPIVASACDVNNGGCSNLCLLNQEGGRTCACPNNFYLATDGVTCVSNCTGSQFVCANDKCIPFWWRCDGENDCGDRSDEPADCREFHCTPGQFQCHNSTEMAPECINPAFICDGENDCLDGSDELNCRTHACLHSQIKCKKSNKCIPRAFKCDGVQHCEDGEDEEGCAQVSCRDDHLQCADNHRCIPLVWQCDGERDCEDGTDEPDFCKNRSCPTNEFACESNGRCIPLRWQCDGERDCVDGSDEKESECLLEFQCDDGRCIWGRWQCDGDPDCNDESDEKNCQDKSCHDNEFHCDNNRCKPEIWRCDGEDDCGDGSDENLEMCATMHCPVSKYRCANHICINSRFVCDDIDNCGDGSDEQFCDEPPIPCISSQFQCRNNRCVDSGLLCNGVDNCGDGSDERGCRGNCNNSNIECSHKCSLVNGSYYCTCHSGFELQPDGVSCGDINECRQFGVCSQECENKQGSFVCSCVKGYRENRQNGTTTCRAEGPEPYLFVAEEGALHHIATHSANSFFREDTSVDVGTRIVSLDIHYANGHVYLMSGFNDTGFRLSRLPLNNDARREKRQVDNSIGAVELLELDRPEGLAVDWVGNKLYWTDSALNTLEVAELDGSSRRILLSNFVGSPKAIVVHPKRGLVFFTTWGNEPGIHRINMNGSNFVTIVKGNLDQPTSIAMDYVTEKVYWTDSKGRRIECSDLNGSNRVPVISFPKDSGVPFSVDVFEEWIYGVTKTPYRVFRVNKFGNESSQSGQLTYLTEPLTRMSMVKIVQKNKQDSTLTNPCLPKSCANHQLCLINDLMADNAGITCLCQDGYIMTRGICIKEQVQSPCQNVQCMNNGTCIKVNEKGKCRCPFPFYGPFCERDRCKSHCQNNGQCTYSAGGVLSCECRPRWEGPYCTIDKCRSFCSGHGRCIENQADGTISCSCDPKWTGDRCDERVCDNHCQNGGVCRYDNQGQPTCHCPKEFPGTRCEGLPFCQELCGQGNDCEQIGTEVKCVCSWRYQGPQCEVDRCANCSGANHSCTLENDAIKCIKPDKHTSKNTRQSNIAVAVVISVLIVAVLLILMVLICHRWRGRLRNSFRHRRIEEEEEEDDMEFGNPTFKYSRQLNQEEDEGDQMEGPFTIRDHKARTNFSNPIYGSLINSRASELSLEEQNRGMDIVQQDTERLLEDDDDDEI